MVGAETGGVLGLVQPPPLVEKEEGGGEDTAEDKDEAGAGPQDDDDEITGRLGLLTDGLQSNLALRCPLLRQAVCLGQERNGWPRPDLVLHVERDGVVSPGLQLAQAEVRLGEPEELAGVELHVGEDGGVVVLSRADHSLLTPAPHV